MIISEIVFFIELVRTEMKGLKIRFTKCIQFKFINTPYWLDKTGVIVAREQIIMG